MLLSLLLQFDWQKLRPEALFGGQVLERTPAGLSLIYLIGIALLLILLLLSFIRNVRPKFAFERDLPREVKRKLSSTMTNRSLRIWQGVFVVLALTVFGFHVYWVLFAEKDNQRFQELSIRDLRYRRSTSSQLRGWMLDRSGKLGSALAYYKKESDGDIVRAYALDREMAHLLGTEIGTPGLERTLYPIKADPMPEAWEVLTTIKKPEAEQRDVRITIDRDLQTFAAEQLKGRNGAVVIMNPQTGDVLAMYSNPSFSLSEVKDIDDLRRLERDRVNKPLLSRSTREFYLPGSTFKTFTMLSAFRAGKQDLSFPDNPRPDCYTPFKGSKPICDFTGSGCEGIWCGMNIPLEPAFTVSSNQYFAQLANTLGRQQMAETARLVGMTPVETNQEALTQGFDQDIWHASTKRIASALAPVRSTIVTGNKITLFEFGLQGMGQGALGITPFQMALIASASGNLQGNLMKPKIEADLPPQVYSKILTPEQAEEVRRIMATVTEEGTAEARFTKVVSAGIRVGGKTGSAEREYVVYDENGKPKQGTCRRRVERQCVEYNPQRVKLTDSWFISIAPLENPQLAIAVVVEKAGQGARAAAPIAAEIVLKARDLGLLGDQYKPKPQTPVNRRENRR